jgi:hypothetical protein
MLEDCNPAVDIGGCNRLKRLVWVIVNCVASLEPEFWMDFIHACYSRVTHRRSVSS